MKSRLPRWAKTSVEQPRIFGSLCQQSLHVHFGTNHKTEQNSSEGLEGSGNKLKRRVLRAGALPQIRGFSAPQEATASTSCRMRFRQGFTQVWTRNSTVQRSRGRASASYSPSCQCLKATTYFSRLGKGPRKGLLTRTLKAEISFGTNAQPRHPPPRGPQLGKTNFR